MSPTEQEVLDLAKQKGVLKGSDLEGIGIARQYLHRLYTKGVLHRVGRGLYTLANADASEHQTLIEAARRIPHGVVCLLSALRFHEVTTQAPYEVWIAIQNNARRPQTAPIPTRVVYMSGEAFRLGVEHHQIDGVSVPVFTLAKTVADCFKFRNKIGLDVAIEALRDFRRSPAFDIDDLWHYAKVCRVAGVMRPYLEAIV